MTTQAHNVASDERKRSCYHVRKYSSSVYHITRSIGGLVAASVVIVEKITLFYVIDYVSCVRLPNILKQ